MFRFKFLKNFVHACSRLQAPRVAIERVQKLQATRLVTEKWCELQDSRVANGNLLAKSKDNLSNIYDSSMKIIRKHSTYLDCFMTNNSEDLCDTKTVKVELMPPKTTQHTEMSNKTKSRAPKRKKPVTIELAEPYKLHCLEEGPNVTVKLSRDMAQRYYRQMRTIRSIENAADALYKERIIRSFCHLYTGQEACAVGMRAAMRDNDKIITAYRCHGWAYLMGISPFHILADLTGRHTHTSSATSNCSVMHLYAKNFYGGTGIVGSPLPLGAGSDASHRYHGDGGTCLAIYGDGSRHHHQVFEAYNMAYLWKLPCVFVVESNACALRSRNPLHANYYARGENIPGIWVDGMNVLAVKNATKFASRYARKHGPIILEMNTFRYHGNAVSEPDNYGLRDELVEVCEQRDPLKNFQSLCKQYNLVGDDEAQEIDAKVETEVQHAVDKAKAEREGEIKDLISDMYAKVVSGPAINAAATTASNANARARENYNSKDFLATKYSRRAFRY